MHTTHDHHMMMSALTNNPTTTRTTAAPTNKRRATDGASPAAATESSQEVKRARRLLTELRQQLRGDSSSTDAGSHAVDEKAFQMRFHTFGKLDHWMLKPLSLSPIECAHCGWQLIAKNRLGCTECQAELSVDLNDADASSSPKAIRDALEAHFVDSVHFGAHRPACRYRVYRCPSAFGNPFLARWSTHQAAREYVEASVGEMLSILGDDMPIVLVPDAMSSNRVDVIDTLVRASSSETRRRGESWLLFSAAMLACCGWSTSVDDDGERQQPKLLACRFCLRRVDVDSRRSVARALIGISGGGAGARSVHSMSIDELEEALDGADFLFDPVANHRAFCPMIGDQSAMAWALPERRRSIGGGAATRRQSDSAAIVGNEQEPIAGYVLLYRLVAESLAYRRRFYDERGRAEEAVVEARSTMRHALRGVDHE